MPRWRRIVVFLLLVASFAAATCQDDVCSGNATTDIGSSILQQTSNNNRTTAAIEEKGEKKVIADKGAETDTVERKSNGTHALDGRHSGVGDTIAGDELVTNSARSKDSFDAGDHEAGEEDIGNDESSKAVNKTAARSEATVLPATPFATNRAQLPVLDTRENIRPDGETQTGKRKNDPNPDGLAAVDINVQMSKSQKVHKPLRARQSRHRRKSPKHHKSLDYMQLARRIKEDTSPVKEDTGPVGMSQPRGRWTGDVKDATKLVGALAAKQSTTPLPQGAVTSPVSTQIDDIMLAKNATQDARPIAADTIPAKALS